MQVTERKRTIVLSCTWYKDKRLTDKKPFNRANSRDQSPWTGRRRFPCRNKNCQDPTCNWWHPPCISELQVGIRMQSWQQVSSNKRSKKGDRKDQLSCWRNSLNWDSCLKNLVRESPFSGKKKRWDQITLWNFSKDTSHQSKLQRSFCTSKFEERYKRKSCSKKSSAEGQVALSKECKINWVKNGLYSPIEVRTTMTSTSKLPEEREFAIDSRASMHILSERIWAQKNWRLGGDPWEVTTNDAVQTKKEVQVYVHDIGPMQFYRSDTLRSTRIFIWVGQRSATMIDT